MEVFSQTMNVKRNVSTLSDLTWCSMRKETCTNNELGEFLMVSGIGKRTGHRTLKNAKEKATPHNTPPMMQYRTTRTLLALQYSNKDTTCIITNTTQRDLRNFPEEHLNTAGLNAMDSFLKNCGRGLDCRLVKGGPYNLICKSHKYTSPSQPNKATWSLYRMTMTSSKEICYHTPWKKRASCYTRWLVLKLLSCEA